MAFPPTPTYPKAIDTDYTLYLVYNTTETRLAEDNSPWSQEISIVPVAADKQEIWPTNGFANINGEILYYDSVEYDENNKINKLKGCARQLGGENTKKNKKGTWIRSYVVAEHHNQLVTGILKTQNFIGRNFDDRSFTLDWKIRNLEALDIIFDDYNCPDINFTWNLLEDDPIRGRLAEYSIAITPPGSISSFRLDFGDGNFTTTELNGQHRYAINARMDPVVRASNDRCQIIQTPIERENPAEPPPEIRVVFDVPIPEIVDVPDFIFVPCEVPEPDINLPPLVMGCGLETDGTFINIPSIITGPDINMVSNVIITSDNPVQILHSQVTITSDIPEIIVIDPPIPATIVIDSDIPSEIIIVPPTSNILVEFDMSTAPQLDVNWNMPTEVEVQLAFARSVRTPARFAADEKLINEFGSEFADLFEANDTMQVEYDSIGIPEEIVIKLPDDPYIKIDSSDLDDKKIKIDASDVKIPENIFIHGPETALPNIISFDTANLNESIQKLSNLPSIKVDVPEKIVLEVPERGIPERIIVDVVKPIPDKIFIESNLPDKILLDVPEGIPLLIPENLSIPIKLEFPDELPTIPVHVTTEVKITMDQIMGKDTERKNCVMIVPCDSPT